MSDTGFKLIAIRPRKNCPEKYLKNLKEGMIYSFYEGYEFYVAGKKEPITHDNYASYSDQPLSKCSPKEGFEYVNLYSVKNNADPSKNININISAVVGTNGSGKSSLIELFFLSIFKLSVDNKFITDEKGKDVSEVAYDLLENLKKEMSPWDDIKIDLVFEINGELKILNSNNSKVLFKKANLGAIFYSICLNYSLYGLNSRHMGSWIEKLFHKNDGYLTPLVINPMRANGIIDVNKEFSLNQTRFLTNLIDTKFNENILLDGKQIDTIRFTLPFIEEDAKKAYFQIEDGILETKSQDCIIEVFEACDEENGSAFNMINYLEANKGEFKDFQTFKSNDAILVNYLTYKLFKIAKKYEPYKNVIEREQFVERYSITNFKEYLKKILADNSHVTLKFRQILNTLKFGHIINDNIDWKESEVDGLNNKYFELSFSDFKNKIQTTYESNNKIVKISELIPAAFFHISLKFKGESEYTNLSSGELQMLNSINTVLYHLSNLDSKNESYSNVNIILDEIELYYHPDFQRKFIDKLLKNIEKMDLVKIKSINILFATHSPFILSDIPSNNILRLEDGKPSPNDKESFGANIYTLLKDSFFLKNGFQGEFSKRTIRKLYLELNYLKYKSIKDPTSLESRIIQDIMVEYNNEFSKEIPSDLNNKQKDFKQLISIIGEGLIKDELHDLYLTVFSEDDEFKEELLEAYRKKLGLNKSTND